MQLTEHFTLEELTFSSTAVARGIDNSPLPETAKHLAVLAQGLEKVRAILGAPMHIDSGYRCPSLNGIVRGVRTSAHLTGYAADFVCPQFGASLAIVQKLAAESALQFDQVIQEGTWVHISFAPTMRRQILTAHFESGVATYTHGV
jgi:zinc D-Ala-D-Ala carboxypeptidase